jgi:hypothetical protein
LQTVAELDPDICDERDSYYWLDSGEVLKALRQPALLAYLSVALTGQLAEAYLDRSDGQLAAELTDKLWVAVDSAYSTVNAVSVGRGQERGRSGWVPQQLSS